MDKNPNSAPKEEPQPPKTEPKTELQPPKVEKKEDLVPPPAPIPPSEPAKEPIALAGKRESPETAPAPALAGKREFPETAPPAPVPQMPFMPNVVVEEAKAPAIAALLAQFQEEIKASAAAAAAATAPPPVSVVSVNAELFIGNLPFAATEQELRTFFEPYGKVVSTKLVQKDGRPAGCGFVQFSSAQDAARAKESANGQYMNGRPIVVRYSSDPIPEFAAKQSIGAAKGSSTFEGTTIFVGNLSYQSSRESIEAFFSRCGKVKEVRMAYDMTGRPKGFAHVEFERPEAVQEAMKLYGQELDGRTLRIDVSVGRFEKSGGGRGRGRGRDFGSGRGGSIGVDFGGRGGRGGYTNDFSKYFQDKRPKYE